MAEPSASAKKLVGKKVREKQGGTIGVVAEVMQHEPQARIEWESDDGEGGTTTSSMWVELPHLEQL